MQKKSVNKFILLFLTFVFLIGIVSAWNVSITNPVNGSYFGSKPSQFDWSFSGISQSNLSNNVDSHYFINNGNKIYFRAYSDYPDVTIQPGEVQEGWNELNISINNITGEKENASILFWVDSVLPIINVLIPATNPFYTNQNFFTITALLTELNIKQYNSKDMKIETLEPSWTNPAVNYFNSNTPFNYPPSGVLNEEGWHNYTIFARDKYPNDLTIREINITGTIIRDITDPILTLNGADPITLEALLDSYIEFGATATDNLDPLINSNIIIDSSAVDTNTIGTYIVTYDVQDQAGNSATQITRNVNVVDTTKPIITLVGSDPINIEVFTPYIDAGATALDNYDGDVTGNIITINPVDINTLGTYIVTYDVMDSSGNIAVQVTRNVNVVDTTAPIITLLGSDPIILEVGTPYVDAGATALDNYDGDITGNIITINPVDINTLGTYIVTYDVMDSSGNSATQITRTVNVVDTTIPVITLVGSDPIILEVGTPYVDAGATALDNYDGDITGNIIVVNPINANVVGVYVITYDVQDSSLNSATQITRTINVVDTIFPTISINLPTNNSFSSQTNLSINFTVQDITLNTCWYSNDTYTANITLANCNTNITTMQWAEGQHNLTIWVNDSANNVNFSQVTFTIDTTLPSITNFQAIPSQNISQNNPTTISAVDVSDANLAFTGLMFVDFNNLISSDQILFIANMNETPVSGPYGPINWDADYLKITDGTISEPVSAFITDFAPGEYIVTGYHQNDSTTEDCMLGFDMVTKNLTTSYCGNPIIDGVSKFTIKSLKFSNGIFSPPSEVNGSAFTLYNFPNPLNPVLESALAPSGDYNLILQVEDSAGNENGEILNISVDNTAPILTNYLIEVQGLIPTTNNAVYISPQNSLNIQDGLNLNITANEIVDWTIRIQNPDGSLATSSQWITSNSINTIKPVSCNFWNGTLNQCSNVGYLSEGTYTINVTLIDNANNLFTDLSKSIIVDNTIPTLSSISATSITSSSASIIWTTDENANSNVSYGLTNSTNLNLGSATQLTSHSISLSGLSASTIYYYNVSSCDASKNCNTSTQYTFTTSAQVSDDGGAGGGGGGGGGGSSLTYYACSKWNEWSACSNAQQTRTCLEKITTTSQKGVIASQFKDKETKACAAALTPLSNPTTETGKTEVAPVEPSEKTPTFIGRITGGITGVAVGFSKSKGGKISLIVVAVLALAFGLLAFRRKINRQNKERRIKIIHKSDLDKRNSKLK